MALVNELDHPRGCHGEIHLYERRMMGNTVFVVKCKRLFGLLT
jgi:hypothetical protein